MKVRQPKITAKKWGGDDTHSWAVLIDGSLFVTGLTKQEVPYYKEQAQIHLDRMKDRTPKISETAFLYPEIE